MSRMTHREKDELILQLRQRITELYTRIAELYTELLKKDRLKGMGAEREAKYVRQIADLNKRNKELMGAMREWYEDGFDRGDCGELIVKDGGEA